MVKFFWIHHSFIWYLFRKKLCLKCNHHLYRFFNILKLFSNNNNNKKTIQNCWSANNVGQSNSAVSFFVVFLFEKWIWPLRLWLSYLTDWLCISIYMAPSLTISFLSYCFFPHSYLFIVLCFVFWWTKCVMCLWWWLVGWLLLLLLSGFSFYLFEFCWERSSVCP